MYRQLNILHERLKAHSHTFHKVVDFNPVKEKLIHFDFSNNNEPGEIDFADTEIFSAYVNEKLKKAKAKYGIGGYNELRGLYERSKIFDASSGDEPRRLHLGIDIWGEEGTKVYAPLGGLVHSYAFNKNFGDYGATLVLLHQLDTVTFYTLYGHLSLDDIARVTEFQYVIRGQVIGHFGKPEENGSWPPHLHFQVIKDMQEYKGDYPGVCKLSEAEKYLANCPDPDLILNMMQYANAVVKTT
ncbi:MAG: peptidoglycan DD-metalloendopeptidase family protein [Chitinophagaceae bacterium]|nr:peptidoglycan DD-metalloendopeptidase family protein [Chitinophagaceae bacterium]